MQLVYTVAAATPGRVGYVIPKKMLSRAVDRNRIRRMLRPIVHAARPGLERYDVIVRLRKGAPSEFGAVAAEASRLLGTLSSDGEEA